MKKVTLILALGVCFTLTACGSGSTTSESKDSSSVVVDSAAIEPVDTSVEPIGSGGSPVEKPIK